MESKDLYNELILDHYRKPRNCSHLDCANCSADGNNPLCGDHVTVYIKLENDIITNITFEGKGCAISIASASLMTEALKGKTIEEAKIIFAKFHGLVTDSSEENTEGLGKLSVFSNICHYPARVKCATLVWHTMDSAIRNKS